MHTVIFCDRQVDVLPLRTTPEVLLPYCNIPVLVHILRFLERSEVPEVTLVRPSPAVLRLMDSLPMQMQLHFTDAPEQLLTHGPTLVLYRPCLPCWDMGELKSLCGAAPVRLLHADGSLAEAALFPAGSRLIPPEHAVSLILSEFRRPASPEEYRDMQVSLLRERRMQSFRIGQGVRIGKQAEISGSSIIGNDCVIGDRAVVEDCVLGDGVQVGTGAVLRHCVICRHALIDRGMQLAGAVVGQGEIAASHLGAPVGRLVHADALDGIHEGLPRWNSAETALRAGAAMTTLGHVLAVGGDCLAAEVFAHAAAAGAAAQGAEVWNAGICALSQLIHVGKTAGCDALLWVQGEAVQVLHPYGSGFPLDVSQRRRLVQAMEAEVSTRIVPCGKLCDARPFLSLWEHEIRRILPKSTFTVEVCCGNSALRRTAERLFSGGTGERLVLNLSDDGTQASVFSTATGMVRHEQLLLLSLLSFRENGEGLALPSEFHPAAEGFAAQFGGRILRLFSPKLSPTAAALCLRQGVCMDGALLFAHILRILSHRQISFASAVSLLPAMYTGRYELSTALSAQAVEKLRRSNPDRAVRLELPTRRGLVRLMAYADSAETAQELCGFWENQLRAAEHRLEDAQ